MTSQPHNQPDPKTTELFLSLIKALSLKQIQELLLQDPRIVRASLWEEPIRASSKPELVYSSHDVDKYLESEREQTIDTIDSFKRDLGHIFSHLFDGSKS